MVVKNGAKRSECIPGCTYKSTCEETEGRELNIVKGRAATADGSDVRTNVFNTTGAGVYSLQ